MTRRPQVSLLDIKCSFLLCQVGAAAGIFTPSQTRQELPS